MRLTALIWKRLRDSNTKITFPAGKVILITFAGLCGLVQCENKLYNYIMIYNKLVDYPA